VYFGVYDCHGTAPMPIETPLEQLLTTKQVCKLLNCGPGSLYGLAFPLSDLAPAKGSIRRTFELGCANKIDPDDIREGLRPRYPTFPQRQRMQH
jgi:hypothetical protein